MKHLQSFRNNRKPQLESRLTSWGIRKKLTPDIWRSVKSVMKARATPPAPKKSVVILSGMLIPTEKVYYETKRHELVTMGPGWFPVSMT